MEKKMKILVPIDGSDRALKTVRYISRTKPFQKFDIVLFHVFNSVPEAYWDLEKDPRSTSTIRQVRAWEVAQKKKIDQFMQRANQFLLKAGFPKNSIEVKIQNRKKGVARDIIHEAGAGYHAVVTRRRGATGLRGIVLGSVATKLIEKLTFLPLILVGKRPPGQKILLAFDGSAGAMQAVDFVGSVLGGFGYEIGLIHVIRGNGDTRPEFQHIFSSKKFTQYTRREMESILREAKTMLVKHGFAPVNITTEVVTGAQSRAKAIAQKAKAEDYGVIAMGRRGHSQVNDFFIGRVTNKVIHIARDRTVWVIR